MIKNIVNTVVTELVLPLICVWGLQEMKGGQLQNMFLDPKVSMEGLQVQEVLIMMQSALQNALFTGFFITTTSSLILLFLMHRMKPKAPDEALRKTRFFRKLFWVGLSLHWAVFMLIINLNDFFGISGRLTSVLLGLICFSLPYFVSIQLFTPVSYRPLFAWPGR